MTQIEIRTMECVCSMSRTLGKLAEFVEQSSKALVKIGDSMEKHIDTMERLARTMGDVQAKLATLEPGGANIGQQQAQTGRLATVERQELKSKPQREKEA